MLTAYAIVNSAGMVLSPTGPDGFGFGHTQHHTPRLFSDARLAEKVRQALSKEACADTSLVVVEWRFAETIGR